NRSVPISNHAGRLEAGALGERGRRIPQQALVQWLLIFGAIVARLQAAPRQGPAGIRIGKNRGEVDAVVNSRLAQQVDAPNRLVDGAQSEACQQLPNLFSQM